MTKYQTIQYNGFLLRITYNEQPYTPATRMDPAEGGEIELEEIYLENSEVNIIDLLEPQWDEIKDVLYNL